MPVITEGGKTALLYPQEITSSHPKYFAGQSVPNRYGNLYTIAALRLDITYVEEWVPSGPGEDEGENRLVVESNEWEYFLVQPKGNADIFEWGWCKESEIEKYIEKFKQEVS